MKRVQFGGGPTSTVSGFVGRPREILVDTTERTLTVHDGATPGGRRMLPEDGDASRAVVKGRTLGARAGDVVNVKDSPFNAKGDGAADDTAAIQAALNGAKSRSMGAEVYFPAGKYKVSSPLVLDLSAPGEVLRVSLRGDGAGASIIERAGWSSSTVLQIKGGTGAGLETRAYLKSLGLVAAGKTGAGLDADNLAYFHIEDVSVQGFATGIALSDVLSAQIESVEISDNAAGVYAARTDTAYPNAITIVSAVIANNSSYGIQVAGPSTLTMIGGTVEGNGVGGSGTRWGVKLDSSGYEGAVGANLIGVYFEGNEGAADLWLDQSVNEAAASVKGCTFNRNSGSHYTTANIKAAVGASAYLALTVEGCGFKGFNDYAENAGRPYLDLPAVSTTFRRTLINNFYDSATAAPAAAADVVSGGLSVDGAVSAATVTASGNVASSAGAVGAGTVSPSVKVDGQGFATYRGTSHVTAAFAANSTLAPALLGTKDGLFPFVGSGQQSDGTTREFGILANGTVGAKFYPSGTVVIGGDFGAEDLRIAADGAISHRANATVVIDANSHLGLRPYTVATLPSASTSARMVFVSDGASNKRLAVSDGTNWRWPDGTIVS